MQTEHVREHFRVQVSNYPELMRRLIPFYDTQRDLMLALIQRNRVAPLRVLDVGCGPGLMAVRILAEFPRAELTLIDLTPEMIDACKTRVEGGDRVTYRVGDFRTENLGAGYDIILASLSLHHLPLSGRSGFARRAFKSLAPGGQLITAEVIVDESSDVRERQYELWRDFMRGQGEDDDAWYEKHLAKDHPVEITAWLGTLSDAGFHSAGCFWRYLNFAILSGWRADG